MKRIILASRLCAVCFAACKKKQPEVIPQPKAAAAQAVAVSTAPTVSTAAVAPLGLLNVPGNYIKTTVGHIGEAKAAKALFEKTAKQEADSLDLNNTGGN
jgi:hypothetical protein